MFDWISIRHGVLQQAYNRYYGSEVQPARPDAFLMTGPVQLLVV